MRSFEPVVYDQEENCKNDEKYGHSFGLRGYIKYIIIKSTGEIGVLQAGIYGFLGKQR